MVEMNVNDNKEHRVKHIADIVGEWGKWQRHLFCFTFILWAVAAVNNMGYAFHAFNNDFWCSDVPLDYQNKTEDMKCFTFANSSQSCANWRYDDTQFKVSIISEFDLICSRQYLASLTQASFMLGYVVSGLVFTYYADRYGRRPIVWLSLTIEIISIISCGISVNITQYLISRFFSGMGSSGKGIAMYTILLECCGPKYRSDIAILSGVGWVLGYIIIPALALWLQNFRYMQSISAVLLTLMMVWFYFLYESPRWQIINGHIEGAEITIRKALKMNGLSDDNLKEKLTQLKENVENANEEKDGEQQKEETKNKRMTTLDLFKTPNLRKYTLIFWYSWAVNALIYYGFSFNMNDFGGNFYITFLLSGLVELPSVFVCIFLLRYIGRRKLFSAFMLIITMSSLAVIPSNSSLLQVTFALIGKFAVTSSWNVLSVHGPEVFPTVLRNSGVGSSMVVGRIGSISAPFMKDLTSVTSLSFVMILYATLTAIDAFLGLFLPETKGKEIPDTLKEAENIKNALKMKKLKSETKV